MFAFCNATVSSKTYTVPACSYKLFTATSHAWLCVDHDLVVAVFDDVASD